MSEDPQADMHEHRRRGDQDDGRDHRLEDIANNSAFKTVARFSAPMVLILVSVVITMGGWFALELKADIAKVAVKQDKQDESITKLADAMAMLAQNQAVMGAQLTTFQTQLADIPGIRNRLAENTVIILRNQQDIKDHIKEGHR